MIEPLLSDERFLDDVAAARARPEDLHIWWLGQSGFLIQWHAAHLLFDPYLSDSLTHKYRETDKPHVRMSRRVVAPQRLGFVDVVTSSHNHTDHLDADTLTPLLEANPAMQIVVPAANREFAAERLSLEPDRLLSLDDGHRLSCGPFTLHGVPAAHETIERDAEDRCRFLGIVAQFGPWTVYHSGDTVRYAGMEQRLRKWPIDVALLPINGRAAERRVAGNLSGEEAARLAHDIAAQCVIPCHYDMFEFNTASPEPFARAASGLGQTARVLRLGERHSIEG